MRSRIRRMPYMSQFSVVTFKDLNPRLSILASWSYHPRKHRLAHAKIKPCSHLLAKPSMYIYIYITPCLDPKCTREDVAVSQCLIYNKDTLSLKRFSFHLVFTGFLFLLWHCIGRITLIELDAVPGTRTFAWKRISADFFRHLLSGFYLC